VQRFFESSRRTTDNDPKWPKQWVMTENKSSSWCMKNTMDLKVPRGEAKIMSGRKRKNYDPIDPRNWPKERYIERLKHMGIGINTSNQIKSKSFI
jgi:hypothetical protein